MGLPGQRRSKSSKLRRAAHFALKKQVLVKCSHCGKKIQPHTVCPHCGYYKGRSVLKTKTMKRLDKQSRQAKKEKKS